MFFKILVLLKWLPTLHRKLFNKRIFYSLLFFLLVQRSYKNQHYVSRNLISQKKKKTNQRTRASIRASWSLMALKFTVWHFSSTGAESGSQGCSALRKPCEPLHKYIFVHVWLEKLGLSWTLGDCIFIRMFQNSGLQQHLGCGEWLTHFGIP